MAISGVVLAGLSNTFILQSKVYHLQEQVIDMVRNVRRAVNVLSSELKMAGYSPTRTAFDGIPYSSSQLQVLSDLNGDGDVNDTNENIIYSYNAETLQILRNAGSGPLSLAGDIEAFSFEYLDAAGTATTTTAGVRQIRINIVGRTPNPDPAYAPNNGYRRYELSTLITPKNLLY